MNAALAIAVCTLVGAVTAPNASVAETKKVDGYEGYKFGMTLEQALKVRPYARQIQCDYDDATTCIEYELTISGFPATVTVQFRPTNQLLLSKILIAFSSMDEPIDHTCRGGKSALETSAAQVWGRPAHQGSPSYVVFTRRRFCFFVGAVHRSRERLERHKLSAF
jgi:hypothetical protein